MKPEKYYKNKLQEVCEENERLREENKRLCEVFRITPRKVDSGTRPYYTCGYETVNQ